MSFNIFNFMNENSQLSANSNCEIFNFGKSSQMQGERSACNSQNPNENSNNNQNFLFHNENDFNPENFLFQFNNSNNNDIPTQSQKSNSNLFGNNNSDFLNFSQFHYQNQNFNQENNFNFKAGNYAQINPDFTSSTRNSQMWQDGNNNQKLHTDAYNYNSNYSEIPIENSVRINENYNTKKNQINLLNGYQNNLSSSRTSTKSNKSLSYFKNNNNNKSPKHIVDTLKIINEAVENENNDDFGFLLQNQTPEKNNINKDNAFEDQFFLSNNKSIKEEPEPACNNNSGPNKAAILDNNKSNITSVRNNNENNNAVQINSASNENSNLNNQIKTTSNMPAFNPNKLNPTRADNSLFRNKNNQIDLFASGNKFQDALEQERKADLKTNAVEPVKDNKILQKTESLNPVENNMQTANEEIKSIKNFEIQKLCEDLDTLENDLFSTLTFKKRNFFDLGNPQSEEIMEKIRQADLEELSKLLNYKGKEFKSDESDFQSFVNNNNNKYIDSNKGIRNRVNEDKQDIIDVKRKEANENNLNEKALRMQTGKTNENNNVYQKFFDSQPPVQDKKLLNNLSFPANLINKENALIPGTSDNNINVKIEEKTLDDYDQERKLDNEAAIDNNLNNNRNILIQREKLKVNIPQPPVEKKTNKENSYKPSDNDLSSSNAINIQNKMTKFNNLSQLNNPKHTKANITNDPAKSQKSSDFAIEGGESGKSRIISQIQDAKFKEHQLNSDYNPKESLNNPSSSNNRIDKILKEDKKINKFQNPPCVKKNTFPLDQITIPNLEELKKSQNFFYNFNISNIFVPLADEEIEKLATSHSIASLSNMFEGKKSLVKYANDIMENYTKLFMAVENFRVNFKKYWEIYMLNYLMEVEYYNFILGMIEDNHKYDLNKLETNVMKIAKKYKSDE